MKVLVFLLLFVICCSVSAQNYQLRNFAFNNQSAGAHNQLKTSPLINNDTTGFDLSKRFSIVFEYLYYQPTRSEFTWMINPQYFINLKNSISFSLGYFANREHGQLYGGYISPRSYPSNIITNVSSETKSGSAILARINHSTIFPIKSTNLLISFEIAKSIGLINLHNELINSITENYLFFNSKVGLSANIYFHQCQFGIEPIEWEYSFYKNVKFFTYRPSVYIGILF